MVEILLATYGGEKYLAQQIDSILTQSYRDWTLLIHDDGSIDGTLGIAKSYQAKHPDKIFIIDDGIRTGGARNNFNHLISHSVGKHIMFCDQDDVWLPNKIEISYATMVAAEGLFGNDTPIVVFSDYCVVDANLTLIATSGWDLQRNGPGFSHDIKLLAVRNCITGCACIVNRAALNISTPIPREAIMHDWWIGLCVLKYGGRLIPVKIPTVLYRQHNANVIGVTRYNWKYFLEKAMYLRRTFQDTTAVYRMAKHIMVFKNFVDFIKFKLISLSMAIRQKCDPQ